MRLFVGDCGCVYGWCAILHIAICLRGLRWLPVGAAVTTFLATRRRGVPHSYVPAAYLIQAEHPMAKPLSKSGPSKSRWRVTCLGKRIGTVEAPDEKSAIAEAMKTFHITPVRRFLIRVTEGKE